MGKNRGGIAAVMKFIPRWKDLSLRSKSTLLIEGLVVFVVLVTGIITTVREKNNLQRELEKRGLALAVDLAKYSSRPLLSEDLPTLRRFINHTMEEDYVLYTVLLDPRSRVVMHSDLAEVGKTFTDPLSKGAVNADSPGFTREYLAREAEGYFDIYAPVEVSGVRLGTVRLGYSYGSVEVMIAKARLWILAIGGMTTLIGGIAAYFLAGFISSPINKITDAIRKVADGDLDAVLSSLSSEKRKTVELSLPLSKPFKVNHGVGISILPQTEVSGGLAKIVNIEIHSVCVLVTTTP